MEIEEFRYPFASAVEFFGSHWREIESLHLCFAWVALLIVASLLILSRKALGLKLLALYFGLTIFNNPAFQLVPGATLGDAFGVLCVPCYAFDLAVNRGFKVRFSAPGFSILCATVLMALHALVVHLFYPVLNEDGAGLTRCLIFLKVFVLGICCFMFEEYVDDCDWLIRQVVNFALIGIACYLIQAAMLLTGHLPYGTFLDAGYVGLPAFGSVSIERGHFGKFLTPLFPLFLLTFLKHRRRLAFFSFTLVTLANFSASSLSYFAFYVAHTFVQFLANILKARYAARAFLAVVVLCALAICAWPVWVGLFVKINDQALQGGGGRSISLLITYLQKFPLGLSYGGSSLRTAPGLEEMNSGLYSFIAQESVFAFPLIGAFFALLYASICRCGQIPDLYTKRVFKTGILIMPFIFFSDLLWFTPTIWLPMLLVFRLTQVQDLVTSETGRLNNLCTPSHSLIGAAERLLGHVRGTEQNSH